MTKLMLPSLDRRLLQTVREEVEAKPVPEWANVDVQLLVDLVGALLKHVTEMRRRLVEILGDGVEARAFIRTCAEMRVLPTIGAQLAAIHELVARLSLAEGTVSELLTTQLSSLEQGTHEYRNLLAEALALASAPPQPVDPERVRAAEEAYANGQTAPFSRQ